MVEVDEEVEVEDDDDDEEVLEIALLDFFI